MRFGTLILAMALIPAIAIAKPDKAEKSAKAEKIEKVEKAEKEEKGKNENEIKVQSVFEAGIDIHDNKSNAETAYSRIGYGKIEISARPVRKVRAEFGFEYKEGDNYLTIDKLYGQYSFADFGTVRAGYMKKSFGLEESAGLDERYFHRRSKINDEVENLGVLDHDLTFQYRHKLGESLRLTGGFSWKVDSNKTWRHRYHQNYSVEYENPKVNLILAGIIGHYSRDEKNRISHRDPDSVRIAITKWSKMLPWVTSLSFKYTAKLFVSESEFTFGENPYFVSDKSKPWDYRGVYIWGARLQEYFPIETGFKGLRQVIPIAEAALYSDNTDNEGFKAQLRAGLTFGFAKNSAFQWRNTYGTRLKVIDGDSELTHRRFDTEVVVIF